MVLGPRLLDMLLTVINLLLDELHLTPLTGIAQLRPQFHQLDAKSHLARFGHPSSTTSRSKTPASKQSSSPGTPTTPTIPRMVHQTRIASGPTLRNREDESALENDVRELLSAAAKENWVPMKYLDEEDEDSYDAFHSRLFTRDGEKSEKLTGAQQREDEDDQEPAPDLVSEWDSCKYLNAISPGLGSDRSRWARKKKSPGVKDQSGSESDSKGKRKASESVDQPLKDTEEEAEATVIASSASKAGKRSQAKAPAAKAKPTFKQPSTPGRGAKTGSATASSAPAKSSSQSGAKEGESSATSATAKSKDKKDKSTPKAAPARQLRTRKSAGDLPD